MKSGNYRVEVVLEEDDMSWHGELIDFEKELNRAIGQIHRVVAWKVSDGDTGESYLGRFPRTETSPF